MMIVMLILFSFIPILFAQMDTLDDKWSQYETSYFKKVATFLVKIKVFKTQDVADKFFNKDGLGWTLAYIHEIKDFSKPYKNKIMWSFFGIKFPKPSPLVDAWHFLKWILILVICTLVSINLPLWFIFYNEIITKVSYVFILGIIWFILFESTYNNK